MSFDISPADSQTNVTHSGRGCAEVLLLSAFILSLLIGLGAFAALLFVQNASAPTLDSDLLQSFAADRISPALALRELAGDPAVALAYQAVNAGELDTAHALGLFDTTASGSARAGFWAALQRSYQAADRVQDAANVARIELPLAVLDATVPPRERHQLLVNAAEVFLAAGFTDAAADTAQQAKLMAERLPDLLPVQRAELFAALEPLGAALDDPIFAAEVRELTRNPFLQPQGVLLTPRLSSYIVAPTPDPDMEGAVVARREAAHALAERIAFTGGVDIEPELVALADALRREDQVRNATFQAYQSRPLTVAEQLGLRRQHRDWQATKLRIALGGYGVSLVPEWEGNAEAIRQELSSMTTAMQPLIEDLANQSEFSPEEQAELRLEGLQWLALQYELGLYPDAQPLTLSERISLAQAAFASFGTPPALPVIYDPTTTPPGFRIQP